MRFERSLTVSALRLESCGTNGGRRTAGRLVPEQVGGVESLCSIWDRGLAHDPGAVAAALPEVHPALVIVVTPTAQLDVVHGRLAPEGIRVAMMEFDEPALVAAVTPGAD